jgi:LysM repeat protein
MRNLLENSCAKGCLVYLLALLIIVGLTTLGLRGLSAKFGAGAQGSKPQTSIFTVAEQPTATGSRPVVTGDTGAGSAAGPTATPLPFSFVPPQSAPQVQLPSVPQITGISGDASSPFYIVQSGDTLWGIATRYSVDVDALRSANNVVDNFIQPGQLLYLPTNGPANPAPVAAPTATTSSLAPADQQPHQNEGGGAPDPGMPHTGINRSP